jgi:hypothetical protein
LFEDRIRPGGRVCRHRRRRENGTERDTAYRPVNQRIEAVKPVVSKNQVAGRIKTGDVNVDEMHFAGGKENRESEGGVDLRRAAIEIPEAYGVDRVRQKFVYCTSGS